MTGRTAVAARRRRFVAVAASPMELLRPASDLVRLLEGADEVDLLVACEDGPADADAGPAAAPGSHEYPDYPDHDESDDVGDAAALLGLPDLRLHRLGLRAPLGPAAEPDVVAALSELVGFDPEPGVYCLAPAPAAGDATRLVVDRAVQRIAQVYGIPLLRYRCLALSVVGEES